MSCTPDELPDSPARPHPPLFPQNSPLYRPPITRISPSGLALPDDLYHLPPPQAQILSHGIARLNTGQLALLQPVAVQQATLLLGAEQHVLGHELVVGDVDEEILLLKRLDHGGQHHGHDLHRRGGDGVLRHQDPRVEVVLADVLREGPHLLDPDAFVRAELDPDGADRGWGRGRLRGGGEHAVFLDHGLRGARGEGHFFAAGLGGGLVREVVFFLFMWI